MLILPVFVVENNGWLAIKPRSGQPGGAGQRAGGHGGSELGGTGPASWGHGGQQVPARLTNHRTLQKIPTILGALLLFCTFHRPRKMRRRIAMRQAKGIICGFFPEETCPDLESTEVTGVSQ